MSPIRTSRAGLAGCPLDCIRPSSQARAASARVLKNLAAQSHLSIRTEFIHLFSYKSPMLPQARGVILAEWPFTTPLGLAGSFRYFCRPHFLGTYWVPWTYDGYGHLT